MKFINVNILAVQQLLEESLEQDGMLINHPKQEPTSIKFIDESLVKIEETEAGQLTSMTSDRISLRLNTVRINEELSLAIDYVCFDGLDFKINTPDKSDQLNISCSIKCLELSALSIHGVNGEQLMLDKMKLCNVNLEFEVHELKELITSSAVVWYMLTHQFEKFLVSLGELVEASAALFVEDKDLIKNYTILNTFHISTESFEWTNFGKSSDELYATHVAGRNLLEDVFEYKGKNLNVQFNSEEIYDKSKYLFLFRQTFDDYYDAFKAIKGPTMVAVRGKSTYDEILKEERVKYFDVDLYMEESSFPAEIWDVDYKLFELKTGYRLKASKITAERPYRMCCRLRFTMYENSNYRNFDLGFLPGYIYSSAIKLENMRLYDKEENLVFQAGKEVVVLKKGSIDFFKNQFNKIVQDGQVRLPSIAELISSMEKMEDCCLSFQGITNESGILSIIDRHINDRVIESLNEGVIFSF